MGRPDYIFGQFGETTRCRDVQHGDGVCCAFAPQLVLTLTLNIPHCTSTEQVDVIVVCL